MTITLNFQDSFIQKLIYYMKNVSYLTIHFKLINHDGYEVHSVELLDETIESISAVMEGKVKNRPFSLKASD